MSEMTGKDEPCETVRIGYDDVVLCRGLSWLGVQSADRMTVQDIRTSDKDDVVIFLSSEGRIVARMKQRMAFRSWTTDVENFLAEIPVEAQQRLLAMYDRLPNRTFK